MVQWSCKAAESRQFTVEQQTALRDCKKDIALAQCGTWILVLYGISVEK